MTSHARTDFACTHRPCDCDIHAMLYRLWPGMLEIGCSEIKSIGAERIMDDNNVLTGPTKELKRQEGES